MRNAIILHGKPSKNEYYNLEYQSPSNMHWLPWLQRQLLLKDILAQTPEMPTPYEPNYDNWCEVFEQFGKDEKTVLVGHSCGGGFLVRWLSEHPNVKVGKVVLVAPWIDPDRNDTTDFFDFTIDASLAGRTAGVIIFNSDNDYPGVLESVHILRESIEGVRYREFHNYGHFCYKDLKTDAFPELLEEIIKDEK